jgi:molecular chaperone GrpE
MLHMKEQEGKGEEKKAEPQLSQPDDRMLRLQAEFENYKKRVAKESAELASAGKRETLLKILSLADTFELALPSMKSAPPEVLKGILMIQSQLKSILSDEGVAPFGEPGEKFDPFRHDALEFVSGEDDGTLAEVIQRGYSWRGGVLRHAAVKVMKRATQSNETEEKTEK